MEKRIWRITRQELYDALWEKQLKELAEEWQFGYYSIIRLSDDYKVPRPPMGYWMKKKNGIPAKRPPLKPLEGKEEIVLELYVRKKWPVDQEQRREADRLIAEERRKENQILVATELIEPHPLVELTATRLRNGKPNEKHLLVSRAKKYLDIQVTENCLDRALRIMDALIKALEGRGFTCFAPFGMGAISV